MEELNDINNPYTLRSFYNRHRDFLLSNDQRYETILEKINKLDENYCAVELESKSLKNLAFDIECDKEVFDDHGWVPESQSEIDEKIYRESLPPQIVKYGDYKSSLDQCKELNIPPNPYVRIEILKECEGIEKEVQKELMRIVIDRCNTSTAMSKFLGISIRTVRNRLNNILSRSLQ